MLQKTLVKPVEQKVVTAHTQCHDCMRGLIESDVERSLPTLSLLNMHSVTGDGDGNRNRALGSKVARRSCMFTIGNNKETIKSS